MRGGISVFGDYSEEGEEGERGGAGVKGSQCSGFLLRENFRLARSIFFVARHVSPEDSKKSPSNTMVLLHTYFDYALPIRSNPQFILASGTIINSSATAPSSCPSRRQR